MPARLIISSLLFLSASCRAASLWDIHPTPLEKLEQQGYQPTFEVAASLLADVSQSTQVRATAAFALAELASEDGVPFLSAATKDTEIEVRSAAAWALGVVPSKGSTRVLEEVLKNDSESEPRAAAILALRHIWTIESASALLVAALNKDESESNRLEAISGIAAFGNSAQVESLESLTKDDNAAVRNKASITLVGKGYDQYLDEVIAIALDRNADFLARLQAIEALERYSGEDFGDPLADPPEVARRKIDNWWTNEISKSALPSE
jgi:HEAT repeat protein